MHEVAVASAIRSIAERARAGRPVVAVAVDVGALRQVVPETLGACWELVTRGTGLAGARLEVTTIPAVVACHTCGHRRTLADVPSMVCEACGGTDTAAVAGEELLVRSIDVGQ